MGMPWRKMEGGIFKSQIDPIAQTEASVVK